MFKASLKKGNIERTFEGAASWDELVIEQVPTMLNFFYASETSIEVKLKMFFYLSDATAFERKWLVEKIDTETVTDTLKICLSKFFEEMPTTTQNPIPKLNHLHGPGDTLQNISFIEFIKAEKQFERYVKSKKEEHVNELIAILWRPRNFFITKTSNDYKGDLRKRFNEYHIKTRAKKIARWTPAQKAAAIIFYKNCRDFLVSHPVIGIIFNKTKGSTKRKHTPLNLGWHEVLLDLARTKQFGDYEHTSYSPLILVLTELAILKQRNIDNQ